MNTQMLMKLSLIISKMGIAKELSELETNSKEELGKALVALAISNLYKAENEVYQLIADYKKIPLDEAKTIDILPIIREFSNSEYIRPFLQLS